MTWKLSGRTVTGLLLLTFVGIIASVLHLNFVAGYIFGFTHAWLLCLYTVRRAARQARVEAAMREAFWS